MSESDSELNEELDNRSEIEKSQHVMNQKIIWNNIVDLRIQLQQALISSNNMPKYDIYPSFLENDSDGDLSKQIDEVKQNVKEVLNGLFNLQNHLIDQTEVLKEKIDEAYSNNKKRKREYTLDMTNNFDEIYDLIRFNNESFNEYYSEIIDKWSSKVLYFSNNINANKFRSINKSIMNQVEEIMNHHKTIKKTQLKRTKVEPIGSKLPDKVDSKKKKKKDVDPMIKGEDVRNKIEDNYDEEIYDDGDFFQLLLKEYIETGEDNTSDPFELTKRYLKLRSLKQKQKRVFERGVSKGKRLKYTVHEKLVSFMAPNTRKYPHYDTKMSGELLQSLFGQERIQMEDSSDDEDSHDDSTEEKQHVDHDDEDKRDESMDKKQHVDHNDDSSDDDENDNEDDSSDEDDEPFDYLD